MSGNSKVAGRETSVEKRVLINPVVIEESWKPGKKPLNYTRRWRPLRLHLTNYVFVRSYHALTTDLGPLVDDFCDKVREESGQEPCGADEAEMERLQQRRERRSLAKRAMEDFDALTEEEQSEICWAHLEEVQTSQLRRRCRLEGWAEIERERAIEVFSVDTKKEPDTRRYRKTFDRMKVSLRGGEKDAAGSLLHWIHDDSGEDYLVADMVVEEGTLSELEEEIRRRGGGVPLDVYVEAHLFQSEVDEALSEPDHYQRFQMVYDTPSSIFVDSIHVGGLAEDQSDGGDEPLCEGEEQDHAPDPEAAFQEGLLAELSGLASSQRYMVAALWAMVVLIGVMLFAIL